MKPEEKHNLLAERLHLLCFDCWDREQAPNAEPLAHGAEIPKAALPCCICGAMTRSNIHVLKNPDQVRCKNQGAVHS